MSDSLQPYGLQPANLLCPWGFSSQEYWNGLPFLSPGVTYQYICANAFTHMYSFYTDENSLIFCQLDKTFCMFILSMSLFSSALESINLSPFPYLLIVYCFQCCTITQTFYTFLCKCQVYFNQIIARSKSECVHFLDIIYWILLQKGRFYHLTLLIPAMKPQQHKLV